MDWYKHDIGAYRRATHHLSPLEDGIYRRLLDEYYSMGGPLPDNLKIIKNLCRVGSKWEVNALSNVLAEFFPVGSDGKRHNARADQELSDYYERCVTNRKIAQDRIVNRNGHDSLSSRPPIHTYKQIKKEERCEAFLENGEKCGQPAVGKLNGQWLCKPCHPYLREP